MAKISPEKCDYLAVVSEWSNTTPRGGQVGNAYPILNLTTGEAVSDPQGEFPNPGAVFLPSRGNLKTWDFITLRPQENTFYKGDSDFRQCYYIPSQVRNTTLLTSPNQCDNFAVVLVHPAFDPTSSARQLQTPLHNVTPIFFVQKNHTIIGPLIRDVTHLSPIEDILRIDWRPARDDGIVYEFTPDELAQKGVKLAEYTHPEPELNRIIAATITLAIGPVRRMTSSRPVDALSESNLIEWYLARCPGVDVSRQQLAALRGAFQGKPEDNPIIQASRLQRIYRELNTNIAFLEQRERFARQYIESEAGQQRVRELIEQTVAKRASEFQVEVDKRQSQLAAKRDELARQMAAAEQEHRISLEALQKEKESVQEQVNSLESAVSQLQEQLSADARRLAAKMQEQLPLFAALTSTRAEVAPTPKNAAGAGPVPATARRPDYRPISPSSPVQPAESEGKVVDDLHADLARRGLHFTRDFVANVYVCLKAEPLNLIIGPPGYGKSMLVAGLARSLGHADALLRIAVRRSWSEDRYLLGYFDSFHGRYDPGATSLVPRLLQAEADWRQDRQGVYVVLLDEFNLAAPEYYFSQLLQTLPSGDPVREVQLYDPTVAGGDGFPSRVTLGPNVRFWGTINYDETTERLSPRTLDRTGMIFLGEGDVMPTLDDEPPPMPGIAASDLFGKFLRDGEDCPETHWDLVSRVIEFLRSPDPKLGPRVELSPRVRRAIKRYLANSTDVLPLRTAVDFVVQQRILPVVRGQGEDFVARMSRLHQLLSDSNLLRSARHVEEALRRSEQHFGDLDFLSY
jgi:energy-coupling factor transporter ATP-binding protein EcfA2